MRIEPANQLVLLIYAKYCICVNLNNSQSAMETDKQTNEVLIFILFR